MSDDIVRRLEEMVDLVRTWNRRWFTVTSLDLHRYNTAPSRDAASLSAACT